MCFLLAFPLKIDHPVTCFTPPSCVSFSPFLCQGGGGGGEGRPTSHVQFGQPFQWLLLAVVPRSRSHASRTWPAPLRNDLAIWVRDPTFHTPPFAERDCFPSIPPRLPPSPPSPPHPSPPLPRPPPSPNSNKPGLGAGDACLWLILYRSLRFLVS